MTESDYEDDTKYSSGEIAPLFGVGSDTVANWCKRRLLTAIQLPGGSHYRIRGRDAKEFLRSLRTVKPVRKTSRNLAKSEERVMQEIDNA